MKLSTGYLIDEGSFEMISMLVGFVADKGFDSFLAHLDQQVKECDAACECGGELHGMSVTPSVVRGNLDLLRQTIEGARQ
jgi:hypothetical protein